MNRRRRRHWQVSTSVRPCGLCIKHGRLCRKIHFRSNHQTLGDYGWIINVGIHIKPGPFLYYSPLFCFLRLPNVFLVDFIYGRLVPRVAYLTGSTLSSWNGTCKICTGWKKTWMELTWFISYFCKEWKVAFFMPNRQSERYLQYMNNDTNYWTYEAQTNPYILLLFFFLFRNKIKIKYRRCACQNICVFHQFLKGYIKLFY